MKAVSPVRSIRKPAFHFSEHTLGMSRNKTSLDDPLSLLYNMNDCYSRLKELVPSLPQNKSVSKMEILQHVIDYILDLQITLDQNPQNPPKKSVKSLGADISIISFQVFRSWSKNRIFLCFVSRVIRLDFVLNDKGLLQVDLKDSELADYGLSHSFFQRKI